MYKDKAKRYNIAHRERITAAIIAAKNVPCYDCGIEYPSYVMDFDHKENKSFNVSAAVQKLVTLDRLEEEIIK